MPDGDRARFWGRAEVPHALSVVGAADCTWPWSGGTFHIVHGSAHRVAEKAQCTYLQDLGVLLPKPQGRRLALRRAGRRSLRARRPTPLLAFTPRACLLTARLALQRHRTEDEAARKVCNRACPASLPFTRIRIIPQTFTEPTLCAQRGDGEAVRTALGGHAGRAPVTPRAGGWLPPPPARRRRDAAGVRLKNPHPDSAVVQRRAHKQVRSPKAARPGSPDPRGRSAGVPPRAAGGRIQPPPRRRVPREQDALFLSVLAPQDRVASQML